MRYVVLALVIACSSAPTPAPAPTPPSPEPAAPPAVVVAPDAAPVQPDAPAVAEPTPDAGPEPIACTTDDDCWIDGFTPIARPKSQRGRKLRPCKDAERIPACKANVCAIVAYKC
jgi:hypothetical protein